MPFSPEQRSTRARLGAYAMHAKHDSRQTSRPGYDAFFAKFEREVDPDGVLPEDERERRAWHAMRAYMTELALKSSVARGKRAAERAAKSGGAR